MIRFRKYSLAVYFLVFLFSVSSYGVDLWTDQINWTKLKRKMTQQEAMLLLGAPIYTETVNDYCFWYYQDVPIRNYAITTRPQNGVLKFKYIISSKTKITYLLTTWNEPDWDRALKYRAEQLSAEEFQQQQTLLRQQERLERLQLKKEEQNKRIELERKEKERMRQEKEREQQQRKLASQKMLLEQSVENKWKNNIFYEKRIRPSNFSLIQIIAIFCLITFLFGIFYFWKKSAT